MPLTPDRVRAFREDYRTEIIQSGYSGWRHLALMTGICVTAIVLALRAIDTLSWLELLVVPTSWVFANFIEYAVHRGPMHNLGRVARLYKRHTSHHHRFFSHELLAIDESRDFHATLFPAWLSLFFVVLIGAPSAVLVFVLLGLDVALLFYAAVVFYYLAYEWLHLAIHMPEDSALGRLGIIRFGRRHHGTHHDAAKMRRTNFNFAFPLADWLFGTWE